MHCVTVNPTLCFIIKSVSLRFVNCSCGCKYTAIEAHRIDLDIHNHSVWLRGKAGSFVFVTDSHVTTAFSNCFYSGPDRSWIRSLYGNPWSMERKHSGWDAGSLQATTSTRVDIPPAFDWKPKNPEDSQTDWAMTCTEVSLYPKVRMAHATQDRWCVTLSPLAPMLRPSRIATWL